MVPGSCSRRWGGTLSSQGQTWQRISSVSRPPSLIAILLRVATSTGFTLRACAMSAIFRFRLVSQSNAGKTVFKLACAYFRRSENICKRPGSTHSDMFLVTMNPLEDNWSIHNMTVQTEHSCLHMTHAPLPCLPFTGEAAPSLPDFSIFPPLLDGCLLDIITRHPSLPGRPRFGAVVALTWKSASSLTTRAASYKQGGIVRCCVS